MDEQEDLLSKTEAIKPFTEVSNEFIYEVNKRRNISLSLNLFFHLCEMQALSLQIFLEQIQFSLEGADSGHQITDGIVLALEL